MPGLHWPKVPLLVCSYHPTEINPKGGKKIKVTNSTLCSPNKT